MVIKKFMLRGFDRNYGLKRQRVKNLAQNMALYSEEFFDNIFKKVLATFDSLLSIKADDPIKIDIGILRTIMKSGPRLEALLS